jgi:hydrogenase 3 maturation protease
MPANLKKNLKNRISKSKKIALMGIGAVDKADDGAGLIVAKKVEAGLKKRRTKQDVLVILGCTAPENFTGVINKFKPNHLILVDCADISETPGTISFIEPENVGGVSFSTHMLPLKIMIDYIQKSIKCGITIIGIQPKNITYGAKMTSQIKKAADELSTAILAAIN